MPTVKPRHMITETDAVAEALAAAARRWPEDRSRPGRLIVHLIEEGARSVRQRDEDVTAARIAVIDGLAGSLDDLYPEGYLEDLRADWDE